MIVQPETVAAGTSAEVESSAATQGQTDAEASSPDPNDYEQRITSDPAFALAEVKRQQRAASQASDKLRKAKLAIDVANEMGGGDVEAGARAALQELVQYRQLRQDPKMAALLQRALAGERVTENLESDDYEDPVKAQLTQVLGTQARLEQQMAEQRFETAMRQFLDSEIGRALSEEERSDLFSTLDANVKAWMQTPEGRRQLQTFGKQQIDFLASSWLTSTGKLLEVGKRAARAQAAALQQRATDGPSRSTSIGPDGPPQTSNALEAWEYAKRRVLRG